MPQKPHYHIVSNLLPTSFPVDLLEMLPAGHESFAAQLVTFLRVISTKQSREGLWHETYLYSVHAICWVSEVATALLRYCATFPDGAACAGNADELAHLAALSSLFLLKEVVYPLLLPADLAARLEFLPLMLTSVYCAAWVSALSLLSAARLLYVAYRADASAW